MDKAKLEVKPAKRQKAEGNSLARVNGEVFKDLGLKEGDVIQIKGERKTGVIVRSAYGEDEGLNIIRLGEIERENARTSVGEEVTVEKCDVKEAEKIVVAPTDQNIRIKGGGQALKRSLLGRPISKGDLITPSSAQGKTFSQIFGDIFQEMSPSSSSDLGRREFVIKNAKPDGIVFVTKDTKVIIGGESNLEDLPKEESLIVSKSTLDEIQRELTESVEKAFEDAMNKMKQRGIEVEKSEHAPSKIVVKDSDIEIVRKE